jgi:hypothetical protein
MKTDDMKLISAASTINRGLGIIEGVMLLADPKSEQALSTAVEMIDEAMKVVFADD